MLTIPPNVWPTTEASRNTLFFAQAMRGFLDQSSFEGFRAYALDTVGRLREVVEIASDVIQKRMKEAALASALHELAWSLTNDDSAQEIAPNHCRILIDLCKSQKPKPNDMVLASKIMLSKLEPHYRNTLISQVLAGLGRSDQRSALLSRIGFMTSHLLNEGHDRNFLLESLDRQFFTAPMTRPGKRTVRSFLEGISRQPKRFIVLHMVNKTLEQIIKVNEQIKLASFIDLPTHAQVEVITWEGCETATSRFSLAPVDALDTHSASLQVYRLFEQAKSLTILQAEQMEVSWSDDSYVYTPRSNNGACLVIEQRLPGVRSAKVLSGHRLREAERLATRLQLSFDDESRDRITRSLSTAGAVMGSHQDEVRLISLWSSFEVLLGDPPEIESRIGHFIKHLVPLIVVRYHRRLFVAVHDQLVVGYKKKFRLIMRIPQTKIESNRHTTFAKVVTLDEHSAILKQIFTLCSDNPLMLHRLWRLFRHYGNPEAALRNLKGHADRVEWQLNRIYRTRNLLVHTGRSPPFVDALVQNSLEYLRSAAMNVVKIGSLTEGRANLDQVIAEIGFEWEIAKKRLEHQPKFDEDLSHAVFRAL